MATILDRRVRRPRLPRFPIAVGGRAVPLSLAAISFLLAFLQRPGRAFFDTRVELGADPGLFLHRVTQVWSAQTDLGHVQSGQFVGYLFPMGPWYALTHWLGLSTYLAQRLWLGLLMALAAWGVVRLMDVLYSPRRGLAHFAAGLLFATSPFVAVELTHTSVTLLAYAALPWLMVAAVRGAREPTAWRWPAFAGLVVGAAAGGVNLAVLAWVVPGPVLLLAYQAAIRERSVRDVWSFAWRAGGCALAASLWWIVPVSLSSSTGADFLKFTEQPEAIFSNTSMSESLRLLGYWVTYFGSGFEGQVSAATPQAANYLFSLPVIVGTFLVPALAFFGGLRWLRRWVYGPFFGLLAAVGLVVMSAGFPEGTLANRGLIWLYYHAASLQALRTTWKAGPLVALAIACLAGAVAPVLMGWARGAGRELLGNRVIPVAAGVGLAMLAVVWAWPIARGRDLDHRAAYGTIPSTWRQAMADADRTGPPDQRLLLLPGELFGSYRWGDVVNSVGPALARRPTLIREVSRYAPPRSSQLQAAVDDLIAQDRLVPGQLAQLLSLWGVGQVVVGSDTTLARSGAPSPAIVEDALRAQTKPWILLGSYGQSTRFQPPPGRGLPAVSVPDLRRYAVPVSGGGMVRAAATDAPTVLDGDGDGVAELAAHGDLTPGRALFYAGDLDRSRLTGLLASGARLVFTDSNRRRVLVGSQLQANTGPTLGSSDPMPRAAPSYDLFPAKGDGGRTVATYSGLRWLRTPISPSFAVFPQFRPYAAMDGDPSTSWLAGARKPADRYLDVGLAQPHPVRAIRVLPEQDASGRTTRLGFSVNGGPERAVAVRPGAWNTVVLNASSLRTLRVRVLRVSNRALFAFGALGGISELSIPGVQVRESLRLPVDLAAAARGQDLSRSPIEVLLQRTTADFPYHAGDNVQNPQGNDPLEMTDAEPGIDRTLTLPQARSFGIDGWASVAPSAPDHLIDRVAGLDPRWTFDSSSRFEGMPGRRASSAFDGDRRTAWIADLPLGVHPWLRVSGPRPVRVSKMRILPGPSQYPSPLVVTVSTPNFISAPLNVARDGTVRLPRPVRARTLRIDVDSTRGAFGSSYSAVAVSEIAIPGLKPPHVAPSARFATRCGELSARTGVAAATMRVTGTVGALNAGDPLRFSGCGPSGDLRLAAGTTQLNAPPGTLMRPDHLRLRSLPLSPALSPPPIQVSAGHGFGDGAPSGVKVAPTGPAWLVLAQSYASGWRAWCKDASGAERPLGKPVPIDGYANGWPIDGSCREARFAFAPQRRANIAYLLSLLGVVALLLVCVPPWIASMRRRPREPVPVPAAAPGAWTTPAPDTVRRPALAVAAAAVALGAGAGWLLGYQAGIAVGAAALLLAVAGVSERRLLALAGLGLLAVPVLYLFHPLSNPNNFDFAYARREIDAHWAAVVAVASLVAACVLRVRRLRRR